jgi:N-hydroxyarylamine O-acetyltransferase
MAWRSVPTELSAFEARHTDLSTAPESGFVKTLSVQRRGADAVDILRGLTLIHIGEHRQEHTLTSVAELSAALRDVFGFDLDEFADRTLDALWERTFTAHVAWLAAEPSSQPS